MLKNLSSEPIYYVDYIYENQSINPQNILDIAYLDELWGTGMPEPYVAIHNLHITKDMVIVYSKKNLTLKITLPNRVSIMLFNAPEELCNKLQNQNPGYYAFDIVGKCNANEWGGSVTPQIFIENYNIVEQIKFVF